MTDKQYEIVRVAINLAREHQIKTARTLRSKLKQKGYNDSDVTSALKFISRNVSCP